jgi:hypothetical protein
VEDLDPDDDATADAMLAQWRGGRIGTMRAARVLEAHFTTLDALD